MVYPTNALNKAKEKGKKYGVEVERSTRKGKKVDIFKDGRKICSIGSSFHEDYNQHGDDERRERFRDRFRKYKDNDKTCGFYSYWLLWVCCILFF